MAVRARPKVEMGAGSGQLGAWRAELGAAEIQWSERDQRLSREPSNAERNGQADYDAVDDQAQKKVVKFVWARSVKRGQW